MRRKSTKTKSAAATPRGSKPPTPRPLPVKPLRKLIEFDSEIMRALTLLARDRMQDIQELADEAFRDLLKKHHRPVTLRESLKQSVRTPAND
jgi:hypothetical protein